MRESTFYMRLAKQYGRMKSRLSPTVQIGLAEILETVADAFSRSTDRSAVRSAPQSTGGEGSTPPRAAEKMVKKPR